MDLKYLDPRSIPFLMWPYFGEQKVRGAVPGKEPDGQIKQRKDSR